MGATAKADKKKMEGDNSTSFMTLECLRGRLLAERQASKLAKHEAQLMGAKLIEIETKLREETKLRQKAEKKLKLLMKKLEPLKISPVFERLEQEVHSSNSSEICGFSSTSSFKSQLSHGSNKEEDSSTQHKSDCTSLSDKSTYHFTLTCQDSKTDSQR
ncbi:uncharacterized protein LOC126677431 [Mercurialis annua]|uniref:uncharacterized protein LOC126677431 n=1 Tax=Mercurialis annua TaxID=3986 RepID=UPI00215E3A03|nr:uncharacterized protein LOC126677431 [Mercurialis annua]XP_050227998.1 uncharacterized protein LOC126677431 [Mercurialis annua]